MTRSLALVPGSILASQSSLVLLKEVLLTGNTANVPLVTAGLGPDKKKINLIFYEFCEICATRLYGIYIAGPIYRSALGVYLFILQI